jgi:hypothetical protein
LVDAGELTPADLDELEAKFKAMTKSKPRKGTR